MLRTWFSHHCRSGAVPTAAAAVAAAPPARFRNNNGTSRLSSCSSSSLHHFFLLTLPITFMSAHFSSSSSASSSAPASSSSSSSSSVSSSSAKTEKEMLQRVGKELDDAIAAATARYKLQLREAKRKAASAESASASEEKDKVEPKKSKSSSTAADAIPEQTKNDEDAPAETKSSTVKISSDASKQLDPVIGAVTASSAAAAAATKRKAENDDDEDDDDADDDASSPTSAAVKTLAAAAANAKKIRVCVLQPHAEGTWTDDSLHCTPAIYAAESEALTRKFAFTEFTIRKQTAYRQLRQISSESQFDVVWNLCDGARDEVRTGEDTLRVLESLQIGFTGADSSVFEPSKIHMKMLLAAAGIRTPNFAVLDRSEIEAAEKSRKGKKSKSTDNNNNNNSVDDSDNDDVAAAVHAHVAKVCAHLRFPVIVKHISGYGSIGITKDSKCDNMETLAKKLATFVREFDVALVEEFITGEEGTVFVCVDSSSPTGMHVFPPLMIPVPGGGSDFLHYGNKWKNEDMNKATHFFLKPDGSTPLPTEAVAMAQFKKHVKKYESLLKKKEKQQQQQQQQSKEAATNSKDGDGASNGSNDTNSSSQESSLIEIPAPPTSPSSILSNAERAQIYDKVQRMAANAFFHIMQRVGYGRCDFRIDAATREPYFLEINPNCGIFLPDKKTGKATPGQGDWADLMIEEDKDWGHTRFISTQLEIAMQQNAARQPWWIHSYSAPQRSFITKAARAVPKYTRVFGDEVRPVPVVARTLFDVMSVSDGDTSASAATAAAGAASSSSSSASSALALTMNSHKNLAFLDPTATSSSTMITASSAAGDEEAKRPRTKRIKVGCAVFRGDALQSCVLLQHSCDPNCALVHSNTIELAAIRPIDKGEPLSIDYGTLRDAAMPAFRCRCGEPCCRKWIVAQAVVVRQQHQKAITARAVGALLSSSSSSSTSARARRSGKATPAAESAAATTTQPAPAAAVPVVAAAPVVASSTNTNTTSSNSSNKKSEDAVKKDEDDDDAVVVTAAEQQQQAVASDKTKKEKVRSLRKSLRLLKRAKKNDDEKGKPTAAVAAEAEAASPSLGVATATSNDAPGTVVKKRFQCSSCLKTFRIRSLADQHIKRKHAGGGAVVNRLGRDGKDTDNKHTKKKTSDADDGDDGDDSAPVRREVPTKTTTTAEKAATAVGAPTAVVEAEDVVPDVPRRVAKALSAVSNSPLNQKAVGLASVAEDNPDPVASSLSTAGGGVADSSSEGGKRKKRGGGDEDGDAASGRVSTATIELSEQEQEEADNRRTELIAREIERKTNQILKEREKKMEARKAERQRAKPSSSPSGSGGNHDDGDEDETSHSQVSAAIRQKMFESRQRILAEQAAAAAAEAKIAAAAEKAKSKKDK